MPRRHLCDLLLVPLELKRLGDECSLFLSKNCLKQHQFFVSFCWDWSCNWILSINEILHVLSASHIFSHFSWWTKSWHCLRHQRQELEELHNQIVAALDKLVSAVSSGNPEKAPPEVQRNFRAGKQAVTMATTCNFETHS